MGKYEIKSRLRLISTGPSGAQPTSFAEKDTLRWVNFGCESIPEFRIFTLSGAVKNYGEDGGDAVAIKVQLKCRACRLKAIRENADEITSGAEGCNPNQGLVVLPLHLDPRLADGLKAEITPDIQLDGRATLPA